MIGVTINGRTVQVEGPCTILEALRALGIRIPAICHDDRLKPTGNCRLCLVNVGGTPRALPACTTALSDGMNIATNPAELEAYRKAVLAMLARNYPRDSDRNDASEFRSFLREYCIEPLASPSTASVDESHPYIRVDMSRCILCYRCVRICDEVQGERVWAIAGRGANTRIVPDCGTILAESACVSCGACVDTCPTGALVDKSVLALGIPEVWTRTVCPYCGTGCEMDVGTRDGRIVQIRPAANSPVNRGHLCVKGRYAFGFVNAADRVTTPMIREPGGGWNQVSWEQAIGTAVAGLKRAIERHGPDSVGILGSARATNEENYLTQKFARVVIGTNNVDCCARVCHAPSAAAMDAMLGTGAATNSFEDIERAQTILIVGCNPLENHPIVGARIRKAARRGATLIVIDPRRTELTEDAAFHLAIPPATNVALLNALASTVIEEGLADTQFLRERVAEWDEFAQFIRSWTPERVADICQVPANLIRQAARAYAAHKPALSFHGLGLTENIQGTEAVMCLINLALLTGNLGKPGTGINPLRGQNNVQGAAHMGCVPNRLPGYVPIEAGRKAWEQTWGAPVPKAPGANLLQMMDAAVAGRLRALWVIGYDIYQTNPNLNATRRALAALDFVVVQDMFLNETAREFAHVFLPVASSFEKDGTFMNSERRVQKVRRALLPAGDSKPDWEILCRAARAMGKENLFQFQSPEEIWNEIRSEWKQGAGITYARLDSAGLQWPCDSEQSPGTSVLHQNEFALGRRAALRRIEYKPSAEKASAEYPFLLTTGRTLYQFNAGTMTMRTPNARLRPHDVLDISRQDAEQLGVQEGQMVRLRSRYGSTVLPAHLDARIRKGELFATFHGSSPFLNCVVGSGTDDITSTPEYKATAVQLEVTAEVCHGS